MYLHVTDMFVLEINITDVFRDGRHGAQSLFLWLLIMNQLVSFPSFCFVHFYFSFIFTLEYFFFGFPNFIFLKPYYLFCLNLSLALLFLPSLSHPPFSFFFISHFFQSLHRAWAPYEQHPPALLWTQVAVKQWKGSQWRRHWWWRHSGRGHETQQQPPFLLSLLPRPGPAATVLRVDYET